MPRYRLAILGVRGHQQLVLGLDCEDDDDARRLVSQNLIGHEMVLWQDLRRVAVFDPDGRERDDSAGG